MDEKTVEHVASLSRLKLNKDEIKEFTPQLKEIIDAFSQLSEVDTINVQPSFHPILISDNLRDDIPKDGLKQKQALNLTKSKEGYILGPRVV